MKRQRTPSLADVYRETLADIEAGIERCDLTDCGRVATEHRWDEYQRYNHPFCVEHAQWWDTTPEEARR